MEQQSSSLQCYITVLWNLKSASERMKMVEEQDRNNSLKCLNGFLLIEMMHIVWSLHIFVEEWETDGVDLSLDY